MFIDTFKSSSLTFYCFYSVTHHFSTFLFEDFQCPVCVGGGDKAKADCDDNIEFESCNGPNPICVSTFYSGTFHRGCSDEITYKKTLRNCEEKKNCKSGMCTESKCKAEFPLGT